ncbi:TRAP transporter large permease subunit [Aureimonas jatrophae]|uniref:TRAP transporter large permease subunit n=1 Tax=Aureimonas jatrophae TaxID=1166073 RepID=UPI00147E0318|nr:TRAP transporter large permease subunit [Aureimonas jatrophae]
MSVLLLWAVLVGLPISFALMVMAGALLLLVGVFAWALVVLQLVIGGAIFRLLAVRLFVVGGAAVSAGCLSFRLVALGLSLVGVFGGGLGSVAVFCVLLVASVWGSGVAVIVSVAWMLLVFMGLCGCVFCRSLGLVAWGGVVASVLSPWLGSIVFCVILWVSLSGLLVPGIVRGVVLGLWVAVAWWIVSGRGELRLLGRGSWGVGGRVFLSGFVVLGLPLLVVGGVSWVVLPAALAVVLAAVFAVLLGAFVSRLLMVATLSGGVLIAVLMRGAVFFFFGSAAFWAWFLAVAQLACGFSGLLAGLGPSSVFLVAVVMLLVVLVGAWLDFLPFILLVSSVFLAMVLLSGFVPFSFVVFFVIFTGLGLVIAPVGRVVLVVSVVGEVVLFVAVAGVWAFLVSLFVVLVLVVLFASLVMVAVRLFQ